MRTKKTAATAPPIDWDAAERNLAEQARSYAEAVKLIREQSALDRIARRNAPKKLLKPLALGVSNV